MARLSVSKYDTFRTCPRLYYYQHVRRLVRVRAEGARRFGDLLHKGLEVWWKHAGEGTAPWAKPAHELLDISLSAMKADATHIDTDPYEHARAAAMLTAYVVRYEGLVFERIAAQDGASSGIEAWFEVPLRDGDGHVVPNWILNGKKDGIVRIGNVARLVEHKTTGKPIGATDQYWDALVLNLQVSAYLGAAQDYMREPVDGILYDVVRKPDLAPKRKTPEGEREYTKGKGCAKCGGSAGGKRGIVQGRGQLEVDADADERKDAVAAGVTTHVLADCDACNGTGWKEAPRLVARHNAEDEPIEDYGARVLAELTSAPDAYYQQRVVRRTDDQLSEARNDLAQATREIDACFRTMRAQDDDRARWAWPRNPSACFAQYGRRCDFAEVCTLGTDPEASPLYQIRTYEKDGAK